MVMVNLGEWLPDQPDSTACQIASNCLPGAVGYRALPSVAPATDALPSRIDSIVAAADTSATASVLAFTVDGKVYKLQTASWMDITKVGGNTALIDGDHWRSVMWGDRLISTNYRNPIQYHLLGSNNAFINLPGNPPKARHICVVRDFLVVGATDDPVDGQRPNRVRWSGLADSEHWTISQEKQSDFQDLYDGGAVQALIGGEYGVIICDSAIYRMTYVGSPLIFQFDRVETDRGTYAPGSVVASGSSVFYLGLDGFYVFDGVKSTPIGAEKIDKWFFDRCDYAFLGSVQAAIDPARGIVMWAFPTLQSPGGALTAALIYNYRTNRWTTADLNVTTLSRTLTTGYTLEQLDTIAAAVDVLPASLDSPLWSGGKQMFSAATVDNRLGHFTGQPLPATVETPEMQLAGESRAWVQRLRPQVERGTVTVQIGTRRKMSDPVTWSAPIPINAAGEAAARSNSRYHRFRLNLTDLWQEATGIDVVAVPEGSR